MSKRLKQTTVLFAVLFAAAQLVRPERANPATDAGLAIQAHVGGASRLGAVLDRACRDCHSNRTVWPWYTRVAPVSWAMAYGVNTGRKAVNFSEWGAYEPGLQRALLAMSCEDVSTGKMPGAWTLLHPEAKLSAQDIETICAASRQVDSAAAKRF
jgi:hypothetical protein